MAKTWNITLEREELGKGNEETLTFFDSMEIIGKANLNRRYIDGLKWNLKNKSHYKTIHKVKNVESSAGEKPAINTVGIILASVANEDMKSGFLFIKIAEGRYEIIALWPDDFARVCKAKKEIYGKMLVSIVQNPAIFSEVAIAIP
ncbi:MAG TPA: hypothetical protein VMV49_12925 [Candidatus Deferrimicrobium sp.]|nr:hypothetical protein [Candidatus Deferrimicrobium sp.]